MKIHTIDLSSAGEHIVVGCQTKWLWTKLMSLMLFTLLALSAVATATAQQHFTSGGPSVSPETYLGNAEIAGDNGTVIRLGAQSPLSFNVTWNSSGDAVFTSGTLEGGFSNVLNMGVLNATWEITYSLRVIQLEPGKVLIVLDWAKKTMSGSFLKGMVRLWELRQLVPDDIIVPGNGAETPLASPAAGAVGNSHTLATSLGSSGSGSYVTAKIYWTYGYMGADGKYYVIGMTTTVTYWVPGGVGSGGNDQDA